MHLLEIRRQMQFRLDLYGHSAVQHLHALGCLGPELTLGHGRWMTGDDLDLIAGQRCQICHNASSDLRLGSGMAPVNEMCQRGIPVALEIDQSNIADDRDMTLVWALHRGTALFNDRPDAAEVLQLATEHGAKTLGFAGVAGRLTPGCAADVVLLDRRRLNGPSCIPATPMAETVLHRARADAVDAVFVAGRQVVRAGRVVSIDRDAVMQAITDRLARSETAAEAHKRRMSAQLVAALEAHAPADTGRPSGQNWFHGRS